jgi:phage terminase small subunit
LECRKLIDVMRPLFSSLGLNPVARSKLGLTVAATREINSKLSQWMS